MADVKQWITVHPNGADSKGQPIPVMEGQSKGDAVKSFVNKHKSEVKEFNKKSTDELKNIATDSQASKEGDEVKIASQMPSEYKGTPFERRYKALLWNGKFEPEDIAEEYVKNLSMPDLMHLVQWGNTIDEKKKELKKEFKESISSTTPMEEKPQSLDPLFNIPEKYMKEANDFIKEKGWDKGEMKNAMFNRWMSDLNYFYGQGGRSASVLWAKDLNKHLALMNAINPKRYKEEVKKFRGVATIGDFKRR